MAVAIMDDDFQQSDNYLTNDPIVDELSYHVVDRTTTPTKFSLLTESSHQQSLEVLSTSAVAGGAGETFQGFQVVTVKILVTILLVILVVGGIVAGTTIAILSGLIFFNSLKIVYLCLIYYFRKHVDYCYNS